MDIGQVLFLLIALLIGLGIGAGIVYYVMNTRLKSVKSDVSVKQARLLEERS